MKITISQIKNSLDWINSILDSAKEKMYEPEDTEKLVNVFVECLPGNVSKSKRLLC